MSNLRKRSQTASRRLTLAVAAALASLTVAGLPAQTFAQYRIEDGRARDANNRVGTSGRNDLRTDYRRDFRANANQIVTGNVAGLYGFRGNINYREAKEFRGNVATSVSDSFIRRSSGGYGGYGGLAGGNYPTAFYTRSRTVQPPANYVREGYGLGAYIPSPTASTGGDRTVEYGNYNRGFYDRMDTLPPPNNLILPAPAGDRAGSYLSATPLTGIQQYQSTGFGTTDSYLSGGTSALPRSPGASRLDAEVERMRNELFDAAAVPGRATDAQGAASDQSPIQPLGSPLGSPLGQARDAKAPISQNTRYRFTLPPEQQSAQYAEMRKRLEAFNADRNVSDEQAYRAFQEAGKARQADPNAPAGQQPSKLQQEPTPGAPDAQPGQPGTEGQTPAKPGETTRRPAPIKIDSLAAGVSGKGLSELLTEAEQQMKEGKFASAIDKYDVAEQVAPNNPLIAMGRANAELGAGFYARAEAHLREAFAADKALLVGQYNLKKFLGEERLQVLVQDLKDIANREKDEPRPVFLLAYVAYNTGNERMAAGYLDLAEKRIGQEDPLYNVIREHWNLPQVKAAEEAEAATTAPATQSPNK